MDLFTPQVADDRLHKNFQQLRTDHCEPHRRVLEQWADGFTDRDGKFVIEFQTSFNSCFWELYLHAALRKLADRVEFPGEHPDFAAERAGSAFTLEATTANHPHDGDPEWARDIFNDEFPDPEAVVDLATIRLANAFVSKHRKYTKTYSNLPQVTGKPFVLAIGPFEQPYFFMQNLQPIRRLLYGLDNFDYEDTPEGERIVYGPRYMLNIRKRNGSEVPLGYFLDGTYAEISAVVFSNTATFGKLVALSDLPGDHAIFAVLRYNEHGLHPIQEMVKKADHQEGLLDGLNVFHNPYAKHPLSKEVFAAPGVTQTWFDSNLNVPVSDAKHRALLQRSALSLSVRS